MVQTPSFTNDRFAAAHARLLADRSIQHALPDIATPTVPAWIKALADTIRAGWPVFRVLIWVALAVAALGLLWMIVRRLIALRWPGLPWPAPAEEDAVECHPDSIVARSLLREADALAAAGRYAEAARLVLHRSIDDVERHRPALVRAATTSRDLSTMGALPDAARPAFSAIVAVVERSLFAARGADRAAWSEAREAYASFARIDRW